MTTHYPLTFTPVSEAWGDWLDAPAKRPVPMPRAVAVAMTAEPSDKAVRAALLAFFGEMWTPFDEEDMRRALVAAAEADAQPVLDEPVWKQHRD